MRQLPRVGRTFARGSEPPDLLMQFFGEAAVFGAVFERLAQFVVGGGLLARGFACGAGELDEVRMQFVVSAPARRDIVHCFEQKIGRAHV